MSLRVGRVIVEPFDIDCPPDLLALFRDDQLHVGERDTGSGSGRKRPTYVFRVPGPEMAQRLDLMGWRAAGAALETEACIEDRVEDLWWPYDDHGDDDEPLPMPQAVRDELNLLEPLSDLTLLEQLERFDCDIDPEEDAWEYEGRPPGPVKPGSRAWLKTMLPSEPGWRLRMLLLAYPDAEVTLDVTLAVDREPDSAKAARTAVSDARRGIQRHLAEHVPLVILTEGSTDAELLGGAIEVLYPHLVDLVRFLDFAGQRPEGNVGALVQNVKSFAAAGIANRVLALFDNDTAARDGLRGLDQRRLPWNLSVRQLPDIELAADYPVIGPLPGSAADELLRDNVNGRAGGLELYLGRDVLTGPDGHLRPVRWKGFVASVGEHQGEIVGKRAVQRAFRRKLRAAKEAGGPTADQDWSGIHAIVDVILDAFSGYEAPPRDLRVR